MNTNAIAIRLTQTVMIAAIAAAAFMARAADAAGATAMPVLSFPTVTVIGQRSVVKPAVVQMPRVIVTGHRSEAAPVVVASR